MVSSKICYLNHYFALMNIVLTLIVYKHRSLAQQCGYTSIHVTSDDGSHQIFTVKAVDTTEHTQKSSCNDCQERANRGTSGALYAHANAIEYPGNHVDPNQSSSLVFSGILDECGECCTLVQFANTLVFIFMTFV